MSRVTKEYLLKRSSREALKIIIDNLIKTIDSAVLSQHDAGFNSVTYDLPVTFSVGNMSNKDAQIYVYSELLDIYQGQKGFEVTFELSKEKTEMRLSWINGMDEAERTRRVEYIARHTKK
ncbi:hypothetical protein F-S17_0308 [Faustovirus]|nr:hypothetical protein F-LCD7_0312 [Faustovirus]QJX72080.1 metallopeptidase [Faustovirus]QJX72574.1 hypothetical protein F-S17_0308 [Faustovirus]QJX73071.1 hypothetical protein F-VV57_0310 [Faustovirus]QJX73578.1 hypothetical protein F-VV63_0312 [Faustovirus]